jgi:hypothetical protein
MLASLVALVGGCSTDAPAPMPTADAGGGGQSGGAASGAAGGGATLGGVAGAAGSAGSAAGATGFGGDLSGAGGAAGAVGAGGAAGAGGASVTDAAVGLDGVRWELACGATVEDGRVCEYATDCAAGSPRVNFDKTVVFGGEPGKVYNVTLRWRGVVEPRKYLGGQSDGTHFRIGGTPDPDSSTNLYGIYSVEVSAPPMIYYLNDDTQTGHYVFPIDHTKTIEIEAGASVHLLGTDQVPPCYAARNCDPALPVCTPFIIEGIAPAPAAFDGQFIQMDVISVTLEP